MLELCRFDRITISIHWDDHNPPHFHAEHGEFVVTVEISTIKVDRGRFPSRMSRRLLRWAGEHQRELMTAWDDVSAGRSPRKIDPPAN